MATKREENISHESLKILAILNVFLIYRHFKMKALLITFSCLLAINFIGTSWASEKKSNHLILGSRIPGDHLLERHLIVRESEWFRKVKENQIFNGDGHSKITEIRALDQKTNGNGATATVTSGGVGQDFVTINFKSKRGHGINFVVEIFGKPY